MGNRGSGNKASGRLGVTVPRLVQHRDGPPDATAVLGAWRVSDCDLTLGVKSVRMGLVRMRWRWRSGPRTGVLVKKGNLDTDGHAEKRQPPVDRHRGKLEAENAAMPSRTKAPRGCQKLGKAGMDRPLEPGRERAPAHTWGAGFWLLGGESRRAVISGPRFVALCCCSPRKLVAPPFWGAASPGP